MTSPEGVVQEACGARIQNAGLNLFQGAAADELDGRAAGAGGVLRQAGDGAAELLRAVPQDLHRRPGPEDLQGLPQALGGPRPQRRG